MFRYYSTHRPIMPGGYPKEKAVREIVNFDDKQFCEDVNCSAWGYIDYEEELLRSEYEEYELTPNTMRTFWGVVTSVDDDGTIKSYISREIRGIKIPIGESKRTKTKDIYLDWFDDRKKAEDFVSAAADA